KLFVYTTIMRLVEQGKIDLNKDIREYLPDGFLRNIKYDEPITMLNVMSHTTGFEDYLFEVILTSPEKLPTLEETLKNSQPLQVYKPGTVVCYSNYSVSLAAYIAQQLIGQEYYDYLMKEMFLPLGMNNTSAHQVLADKPELIDKKATGYKSAADGFNESEWSYLPIYPSGGVNGTAEDLARFAIALMPEDGEECVLFEKRATLDEMLTKSYSETCHIFNPQITGIAHGFIEYEGEYYTIGHGGNTIAFTTLFNIVPSERFGVIILTNTGNEMEICNGLNEALLGKRDKSVNVNADIENLPSSSELEGTYINARRMHNGFLELYGFLSLLKIKAIEPNKIQLSIGGQTATLIQTSPYLYEKIDYNGQVFKHQPTKVYFEVTDGKVKRISGDFLPLSGMRTEPWLMTYLVIIILSALYFILAPIFLLIKRIRHKKGAVEVPHKNLILQRLITFFTLSGTAVLLNNIILAARMLINNYRSFSKFRLQILLNYPIAITAAALMVFIFLNQKKAESSKGQKVFCLMTTAAMIGLLGILINWQFFNFSV
ncbi:MAG: hypothetical protein K0S55_1942, partial [Clostridia bacterium]|nr:hypothetical protein [Clostridia bacterium]